MPREPLRTLPSDRIWDTTHFAISEGMEKPMPCAPRMIAVFSPTILPRESTSGPPELPGLSGAVCWMMFSMSRPSLLRSALPRALTTPVDTVDWNPNGLPMAITSCPAWSAADSPNVA